MIEETTLKDSIKQLESLGFKVYTEHIRPFPCGPGGKMFINRHDLQILFDGKPSDFEAKGGVTFVSILDEDSGSMVAEGTAWCSPKDAFCKRDGRALAFARASYQLIANLKAQARPSQGRPDLGPLPPRR